MIAPADLGVCDSIAALDNGDVSALQLAEACLARINGRDGKALNAFIHVADTFAREQARASDLRRRQGQLRSPLDGVPIAIKDNIDVQGLPTTNGLATHWMPGVDAPVIRKFRDAGMTILGKLNMHEGALGATTDNRHHGRCMHPHFPGFTPGGSSGGSAASVAAHLCPVSLGTDTMGSVRLPAAYCGLVGFKPSRDYWSAEGVMPLAFGLDTIGPLARSVADIAVLLNEQLTSPSLGSMRVGQLFFAIDTEVEASCQIAYNNALARLSDCGVSIEPASIPEFTASSVRRSGFIVSEVDAAAVHKDLLANAPNAFSPDFWAMLSYGQRVPADRYRAERTTIDRAGGTLLELLDQFDAIISLTAPQRAFSFRDPVPVGQADFTALANFAGCPAISLPLPVARDERPIGLQLMTRPGCDRALLAIAAQVEAELQRR